MSFRSSHSLHDYDMSLSQVREWYQRWHGDHWYKTQMPMTLERLADVCEMSVHTIRDMMGDDILPKPETLNRVESGIEKIEERRVIWFKQPGYKLRMIHLVPPTSPPRRAKLSRHEGFDVFSVCATCQNNKWLPLKIDDKDHIACYSCLPPAQWPSIGAFSSRRSLIRDYIRDRKHA